MIDFTQKQKDVINHNDGNLIVSASAGSGKTTVMIENILSKLQKGERLSQMIVCTFTKAAASDMKTKLSKKLTELAKSEFASAALKELPLAQISTLHSFCQTLVKNYFYCVNVDPEFEIISSNDAASLLFDCAEKVIKQKSSENDPDFAFLTEVLISKRSYAKIKELLIKIYHFALVQEDFDAWLEGSTEEFSNHSSHLEFINAIYKDAFDDFFTGAEKLRAEVVMTSFRRNELLSLELMSAIERRIKCVEEVRGRVGEGVHIDINEKMLKLKKDYNAMQAKYSEEISSEHPQKTLPLVNQFIDMAQRLHKLYGEEKSKKACLDYADLEHYAHSILKDPAVSEIIKSEYKYFFVDEYQDINPIQESIISLIPCQKFFVGDVKQSIYGFRMSRPDIFVEKNERYISGEGGVAMTLNSNFRSKTPILEFVNRVFSRVMSPGLGQVDYEGTAKFETVGALQTEKDFLSVDLIDASEKSKGNDGEGRLSPYSVKEHSSLFLDEGSLMDAEVHLIINKILEIIEKSDVKFSQIAVLLRALNTPFVSKLQKKLSEIGIPYSMPDKKKADESVAANALIQYLRLIDNHNDDVALCSVLSSALYSFSDDELALIRKEGSGEFFHEAFYGFSASGALKKKIDGFLDDLERYALLSQSFNASDTASRICAEKSYFKGIFASGGGSGEAKELAAFLDTIEKSVYKTSVAEFVFSLNKEMPEISTAQNSDAVQIMTIHSSKGLEFDRVILGNVGKEFNTMDFKKPVLLDSKYGIAFKYWDDAKKTTNNTSLFYRMKHILHKRLLEEEMRLLYVALTRAKEGLHIAGVLKKKEHLKPGDAKSYLDWLLPSVHNAEFLKLSAADKCVFSELPSREKGRYRKPNAELAHIIKEYIYAESETVFAPLKVSVSSIKTEAEREIARSEGADYIRSFDPALKGTAYHKFMELFSFNSDFENEWERVLPLVDNGAAAEKSELEKAFNNIKRYLGGSEFHRELPFIADLCVEGNDVLVQGVVDLLIEREDGYEIVDYKTGRITEQNLISYASQLRIYRAAAEKILNAPVTKTSLYSFSSAEFIRL